MLYESGLKVDWDDLSTTLTQLMKDFSYCSNYSNDIEHKEDESKIELELPGVKKENISVSSTESDSTHGSVLVKWKNREGEKCFRRYLFTRHDLSKIDVKYNSYLLTVKVLRTARRTRDFQIN